MLDQHGMTIVPDETNETEWYKGDTFVGSISSQASPERYFAHSVNRGTRVFSTAQEAVDFIHSSAVFAGLIRSR